MKSQYVLVALLLGLSFTSVSSSAQNALAVNPNAQADIKLVSDYITALSVTGDLEKARGLLSPAYMAYGPGIADSANTEQTIKNWQSTRKFQADPKNDFSAQSFRITSGTMKGDWVSLWGTFSYKDLHGGNQSVTFPYQYTAKVENGTIVRDRIYYDRLSLMIHFGFKMIPPGASAPAK